MKNTNYKVPFKTYSTMNKILIFILLMVLIAGCKLNSNQTFINDNIPSEVKNEIIKFDNQITDAIKANNTEKIKDIFADKLIEEVGQSKIDSIFNLINQVLGKKEYKYKDQFYIQNTTKNVSNTIFSGLSNDDDYIIHYKALNKKILRCLLS